MASSFVLREILGKGIIQIKMNKPNSFNALSSNMITALSEELDAISNHADTRVIVLTGSGKAFCSGHDLKEMIQNPSSSYYRNLFSCCSELMLQIQKTPQPVVVKVNGIATAAGCQLVSMCDLAIASNLSRFAVSGINYGLFCSTPSVGLSRNMSRKQALEMLLTGDWIDAKEAVQRGLINRSCDPDKLDAEVLAMCEKIARKPPDAVQIGKRLFYSQLEAGIDDAYAQANEAMAANMMKECAQEGFLAFSEKRPPKWSI